MRPRRCSLRARCPSKPPGRRLILVGDSRPGNAGIAVVYARVSSADQKADLDRQVARSRVGDRQGITVGRVVTETGSALNGKRRKFIALLRDPS